jgi:hypothetical protein
MQTDVVVGVVAFVIVAGYAALAWFRHGRDPSYPDDASILPPAPPPGMTAATATVVAGGGTHVAFMAALLDLASRDEIAFVRRTAGPRGHRVRGGETTDPRVLLNRRNPIGEAETWLSGAEGDRRRWRPTRRRRPAVAGDDRRRDADAEQPHAIERQPGRGRQLRGPRGDSTASRRARSPTPPP